MIYVAYTQLQCMWHVACGMPPAACVSRKTVTSLRKRIFNKKKRENQKRLCVKVSACEWEI